MALAEEQMSVDRYDVNARQSSRLRSGSDSSSSQDGGVEIGRKSRGGKSKYRTSSMQPPDAKSLSLNADGNADSPEDGDQDEQEADDAGEDSDDEPDVLAPSGASHKRGHQTGLSVSLSNANLGKRGRSPSDEEIERPMSKMSKTSGTMDLSEEDDDYNAVDDISESEEEQDVEDLEEKMIIESEEEEDSTDHQRRGSASSTDSFFALNNEPEEDTLHPAPQFFLSELFPEASNTLLQEDEDNAAPTTRRVRFAEEVQLHSSSSTTDSDEEDDEVVYPDLFLQQDSLDPAFRKLIEQKEPDERSSDGDSYWDFENEQGAVEEIGDDGSDSESGSSGYESDEGETTDEEILPPRTVSKPQTSLRQNFRGNARLKASQSTALSQARKGGVAAMRRGPLMGSFLIDDDKPIAVVDGHGKHMLFFPAPKHRRQVVKETDAKSSPGPSAMSTYHLQSETESDVGFSQTDPMLSSPANVMMSGLNNGNRGRSLLGLNSEITGPPEAFFPFTSINSNGVIETDDVDDDDDDVFEDYSDEDDNLRIEDFINFGDDASTTEDESMAEPGQLTDSNTTTGDECKEVEAEVTPKQKRTKIPGIKSRQPGTPTPANPGSLLEHFDRGVVSSFRRNNDRHKSWTRSPADVGIKGSRLHAANALISPLRRRRGGSISSGIGRSPLRPQTSDKTEMSPAPSPHQRHQFGGPLKRRIQNSNHIRRKNTL